MRLVKAHAFGNDFLLADDREIRPGTSVTAIARGSCDRHLGIGADGLIVYQATPDGAAMRLLNADGSPSEISGNGLRCLAAFVADARNLQAGSRIAIDTDAGRKTLDLLAHERDRWTMRAAMGQPTEIAQVRLEISGQPVDAITLRVGNPQCVVLGEVSEARLHTIAAGLATHPHFREGTNVELAAVEAPALVRILIWERGVGPTEASGTGACAAAVAAHRFGGASNDVQVASPGGTQRVEWLDDGLYLTGWAEIIAEAVWRGMN